MLVDTHKAARKSNQNGPAVAAVQAIAKLHGLDIQKVEHSGGADMSLTVNYVAPDTLMIEHEPVTPIALKAKA